MVFTIFKNRLSVFGFEVGDEVELEFEFEFEFEFAVMMINDVQKTDFGFSLDSDLTRTSPPMIGI